jgi:integrase
VTVRVRPYRGGRGRENRWEFDISGTRADGSRFRERRVSQLTSRRDVVRFAERRLRTLLLEAPEDRRAPAPRVATFFPSYLAACRARGNRPSTLDAKQSLWQRHIEPIFGALRLDAIEQYHVDQLLARCPPSASSRNNAACVLRTLLGEATARKLIRAPELRIPWSRGTATEKECFMPHELEQLVAAAHALCPRIAVAVLLGAEAGLRRGEIIALEHRDLDLQRGRVYVARQQRAGHVGPPKGGRSEWVPLTPRLVEALRALPPAAGPRVLTKPDGSPISESTIRRWVQRVERNAGVAHLGPHALRHSAISKLAMNGADPVTIQRFARHRSLSTTAGYLHVHDRHLEDTVRAALAPTALPNTSPPAGPEPDDT